MVSIVAVVLLTVLQYNYVASVSFFNVYFASVGRDSLKFKFDPEAVNVANSFVKPGALEVKQIEGTVGAGNYLVDVSVLCATGADDKTIEAKAADVVKGILPNLAPKDGVFGIGQKTESGKDGNLYLITAFIPPCSFAHLPDTGIMRIPYEKVWKASQTAPWDKFAYAFGVEGRYAVDMLNAGEMTTLKLGHLYDHDFYYGCMTFGKIGDITQENVDEKVKAAIQQIKSDVSNNDKTFSEIQQGTYSFGMTTSIESTVWTKAMTAESSFKVAYVFFKE